MCGPWKISTEIENIHLETVMAVDIVVTLLSYLTKNGLGKEKKKNETLVLHQSLRSTVLVGVARN